jgi:pilus assembly protein CpaE
MITGRHQKADDEVLAGAATVAEEHISPAPRVSIHAFCETAEIAAAVQSAGEDRRLGKAQLKIHMGGMAAATEAYRTAPTPNVVILETLGHSDFLAGLDQLARVCDARTRVVVIGNLNDVPLYRELVRRGVSDYMIAPIGTIDVVRSICGLFSASEASAVGRIIAIVGAKGGVGASAIAHNVAWAMARDLALDSVVADLDLAFGTAGLDYNQDPLQGIADAVFSPERIDTAFMDRLLSKCADHLSLLAAPVTLDRVYDFGADAFDTIFDTLRFTTPCIVLDVPHQWSGWTKRVLTGADDILIVAEPDLANLRNAKNIHDRIMAERPNDRPPRYCLNQVGMPKRPEIKINEFAKAIGTSPIGSIPFDPQMFGEAANNGQMIAEIAASHPTTETFRRIAEVLTGHGAIKKATKKQGSLLSPFMARLWSKKPSLPESAGDRKTATVRKISPRVADS